MARPIRVPRTYPTAPSTATVPKAFKSLSNFAKLVLLFIKYFPLLKIVTPLLLTISEINSSFKITVYSSIWLMTAIAGI